MVVRSSGAAEPFYRVRIIGNRVLVTRTPRRYALLNELAASFAEIDDSIRLIDPSVCSLLIDLRPIVGRNDTAFETALAPLRNALLRRFHRAAFVVRTTIGRLQLKRYLADDGLAAEVFDSDDEAEIWLAAGD